MRKIVIVMIAFATLLVVACGQAGRNRSANESVDSALVVVDTVSIVCADSVAVDTVK